MNFDNLIFLAGNPDAEGSILPQIMMFGMIGLVFYFFMIRPQQRKNKELKKFRESLSKGSKVVTIGGIHGKVIEVNEDTVLLQVEGAKMRIEKSAISTEGVSQQLAEEAKKS